MSFLTNGKYSDYPKPGKLTVIYEKLFDFIKDSDY